MSRLRADAHAKINLALAVTGIRDDGYHELRSVFLRLVLHDRLTVDPDPSAEADRLEVVGEHTAADDDLVLRAARELRAAIDPSLPALRFRLDKRIPTAAGLGGGSSDAAAAIDLALDSWGVRLHPAERLGAAARVGADVPFFIAGHGASLIEGIGEHVTRLPAPTPPAGVLLVTPRERLSTAAVFAEYDREPATGARETVEEVASLMRDGLDGMTLAAMTTALKDANDLWPPALRLLPELAELRARVAEIIGHAVLLTGSGPTLVAIYPSEAAATRAAVTLQSTATPELDGATITSTSTFGRAQEP